MSNEFVIGTIIAVLGLIVAWITFRKTFFSKPKEELQHLKIQFNMVKTLMEEVILQIETHIRINGAKDKLMFDNITFGKYLELTKEHYSKSFSDDMYRFLDNPKITKPNIESMIKSFENQLTNLQQINYLMKTLV